MGIAVVNVLNMIRPVDARSCIISENSSTAFNAACGCCRLSHIWYTDVQTLLIGEERVVQPRYVGRAEQSESSPFSRRVYISLLI